MKILLLSLLLAVATHRSLLAQNVPAPPSTAVVPTVLNPAPAAPGPAAPLSYCAYVDAYCGYDFGNDGSNVRPSFLYSHNGQNEFSINQGVVGAPDANDLDFNADNDSLNLDYAPLPTYCCAWKGATCAGRRRCFSGPTTRRPTATATWLPAWPFLFNAFN